MCFQIYCEEMAAQMGVATVAKMIEKARRMNFMNGPDSEENILYPVDVEGHTKILSDCLVKALGRRWTLTVNVETQRFKLKGVDLGADLSARFWRVVANPNFTLSKHHLELLLQHSKWQVEYHAEHSHYEGVMLKAIVILIVFTDCPSKVDESHKWARGIGRTGHGHAEMSGKIVRENARVFKALGFDKYYIEFIAAGVEVHMHAHTHAALLKEYANGTPRAPPPKVFLPWIQSCRYLGIKPCE